MWKDCTKVVVVRSRQDGSWYEGALPGIDRRTNISFSRSASIKLTILMLGRFVNDTNVPSEKTLIKRYLNLSSQKVLYSLHVTEESQTSLPHESHPFRNATTL